MKNPAAAVSKRIREIRARQRLALTGTPLENNLQELWALYDWLIPGLLGNRKTFTAGFRTPIEKHGDRAKQRLLSARVKPFLMRRTKEEVAPELPEKTVIDELVPLEGAQAALYESIRTAMDKRIREAIAAAGPGGIPNRGPRRAAQAAPGLLRSGPGEARRRPQGERERQAGAPHGPARRAGCRRAEGPGLLPVREDAEAGRARSCRPRLGLRHAAWCNEGPRRRGRRIPVRGPAAVPGEPEGRRHGPQPDRGRHRHCLRSLVEPGGGNARPWTGRTGSARTSRYSCIA